MRAKGEQKKPYRKLTGTSKHAIARCEPVRLDQRLSKTLDFFGIRFHELLLGQRGRLFMIKGGVASMCLSIFSEPLTRDSGSRLDILSP
jgi:hypothetical protein